MHAMTVEMTCECHGRRYVSIMEWREFLICGCEEWLLFGMRQELYQKMLA